MAARRQARKEGPTSKYEIRYANEVYDEPRRGSRGFAPSRGRGGARGGRDDKYEKAPATRGRPSHAGKDYWQDEDYDEEYDDYYDDCEDENYSKPTY